MLEKKKAVFLILILLFFSGNELGPTLFGKYSTLVGFTLTILNLKSSLIFDSYFLNKLILIVLTILIISLFQFLILSTVSVLAIGNLLLKIIMGGLIINSLNDRFPYLLFKIVAGLSVVSLIGFLAINLFGLNLPFIQTYLSTRSYLIYFTIPNDLLRNCGMFWEPGAFAGVLTLCLVINLKYLNYYWVKYKFLLISIIVALISTRSTSGYLVGFVILIFNFYKPKDYVLTIVFIGVICSAGFFVYSTNDFLKEKIEVQLEGSSEQKKGEFSNTRFGSFIFDWHYIEKHPFVGNGFDLKTRYADHKYLFIGEKSDVIGSGNAFSNLLASMGIFFVFGYFFLLWKQIISVGKLFQMVFIVVVFLNLQSEQWFNYPLYLGLPFISFINMNQKSKTVFNKRNLPEFRLV